MRHAFWAVFAAGTLVALASCAGGRDETTGSPAREGTAVRDVAARLPARAAFAATRAVRVELPETARGEARVEDDASRVAVAFALRGASDAPRSVSGDVAVYRDALPGADVVHRARPDGTEDFVLFDAPPAREAIEYAVDVSRAAGLRLVGDALELLDAQGAPRLRVAPPTFIDARKTVRAARLALAGCAYDASPAAPWGRPVTPPGAARCTLTVSWDGADAAYPIVLDPAWVATGNMIAGRSGNAATVLANGKVLISGYSGPGGFAFNSELYDPTSGTFAATGSMSVGHKLHSATLLPSGQVVTIGGTDQSGADQTVNELYDPAAGTWTTTAPLAVARVGHTATLLASGKVLVAAGGNSTGYLATAELFDPAGTGTLTPTGSLAAARAAHTASLLANGKVLLAGGDDSGFRGQGATLGGTEIYDPAAGTFSAGPNLVTPRAAHTATTLASGKVLLAGGHTVFPVVKTLADAEIYDPATNAFTATASLPAARAGHQAALLPSGKVLLAGNDGTATVDLFDPATGAFAATAPLSTIRNAHPSMVELPSGKVLVAGGQDATTMSDLSTAELFDVKPAGATGCTTGDDCASGVCQDGVCCAGACSGTCKTCTAGTGACVAVTGADDPDTCTGASTCSATGTCGKKLAQACGGASECASGSCADGVCCDAACTGQCEACNLQVKAGTCLPVTGDPRGGRAACAGAGATCGGACDGANRAACAYPTSAQSCAVPTCADGRETDSACDGKGACIAGAAKPCAGNLVCDPAANKCKTACATNADCASGFTCGSNGACVVKLATCDGAHTITGAGSDGGATIDCSPYNCDGNGTCKTSCAAVSDCASPSVCDTTGHCVAPPSSGGGGGGGCAVGGVAAHPGGAGAAGAVAALGLLLAAWTRRRRAAVADRRAP